MVCSFCWCAEFEDKLIARRGTTSTNEAGIFSLREFPRIQLNYHLGCNQNLELCSSTVLCCSAERSRYDGSTLNPRYQVRTCTAHYSVLKFRWQFYVYRGCPTYTVFTTADPTTAIVWLMYPQVVDFHISRGPPTVVPLTGILRNEIFFKFQIPRKVGTLCSYAMTRSM